MQNRVTKKIPQPWAVNSTAKKGEYIMNNIIGKIAYIRDKDSIYFGEWGRIIDCNEDGEYFIAIADGDNAPIFDRDQFRLRRSRG